MSQVWISDTDDSDASEWDMDGEAETSSAAALRNLDAPGPSTLVLPVVNYDLPSGRVPGRAPEPSRSRVDDDGSDGTFRGIMIGFLGFSDEGVYMGEGLTPGEACGPHTTSPRVGGGTRAARWCGGSTASLRLSFGARVRDGK